MQKCAKAKKKNPVLRARPTAFSPFAYFFFNKKMVKSADYWTKYLNEKLRTKREILKLFSGNFSNKMFKKINKKCADQPFFGNLFPRRTGFFFFLA